MEPGPYRAWYAAVWPQLYRRIYRSVQNRQEAEDITQEVFARVLKQGAAQPPALSYLHVVALNLIRDRWRRRNRLQLTPLEEWSLCDGRGDAAGDLWIRELFERLPPDYKTVLELRIIHGYSRAEVAERMRRTEAAVRGLQYRALQRLRSWVYAALEEGVPDEQAQRASARRND